MTLLLIGFVNNVMSLHEASPVSAAPSKFSFALLVRLVMNANSVENVVITGMLEEMIWSERV